MFTGSLLGFGAVALLAMPACAAAGELVVARNGTTQYRIVVPNNRSRAIDYAASELRALLHEVSGAELPVASECNSPRGPAFLLGPSQRAADTGLVAEAEKLGDDGVLIKTVGRDIVLLGGGDRGQLYSVYVLLERFAGCRFLAHDCTVTPKQDVLTLPYVDYSYAPPFIYREELYHDMRDWSFAARLRLNGSNLAQCLGIPLSDTGELVSGIFINPFVHSSATMIPPGTYFATHPEYFGLVNGKRHAAVIGGQLCYTNPEVLRICTDFVMDWFDKHPEVTSVDISQNDAYPGSSGACECEMCQAIVKEEGAQHGPILRFVNAIADVVAEKYPGKYVDTLAYDYTIATPKVTKPRQNVIIRLCHYGCYFHGIENEPLSADYVAAIDGWQAVVKNLFVWHYGTNFWHYLAPNPNLAALVGDIRYYAARGVNGLMVQGDIQSTGGELSDFRQYLVAQLMWDPTQDPMAIRADFCDGYYGPAKDDVMEFLASMDRLAVATRKHIPTNGWNPPDVTPPEFVAQGLAVLGRALAKAGDEVHRNRIEKLMVPLWYVQLAWPDQYGLSKEDGRVVLTRFEAAIRANGITTISEGPPNAEDFIARMEAVFGAPEGAQ